MEKGATRKSTSAASGGIMELESGKVNEEGWRVRQGIMLAELEDLSEDGKQVAEKVVWRVFRG